MEALLWPSPSSHLINMQIYWNRTGRNGIVHFGRCAAYRSARRRSTADIPQLFASINGRQRASIQVRSIRDTSRTNHAEYQTTIRMIASLIRRHYTLSKWEINWRIGRAAAQWDANSPLELRPTRSTFTEHSGRNKLFGPPEGHPSTDPIFSLWLESVECPTLQENRFLSFFLFKKTIFKITFVIFSGFTWKLIKR